MSAQNESADIAVVDYRGILKRRWWAIAAGFALGLLIAAVAFVAVPKTYTSTASVLVQDTGSSGPVANGRTNSEINLDTEAQIVKSVVVAKEARADLGNSESARDLAKHVTVTVPANTSVLDIAFAASSPSRAQAGARAFANAYLNNRAVTAEDRLSSQADALAKRIDRLETQLREVSKKADSVSSASAEGRYLSSQRGLLVKQIEDLNAQQSSSASDSVNAGRIITAAQLPTTPSDPNLLIIGVSAVMLGLLCGIVLALLIDHADTRIRSRGDLENLGLDVLAGELEVPEAGTIFSPKSSRFSAEKFRQFRNSLLAQLRRPRAVVMVAGAAEGEVVSSVALNLSAAIARGGLSVAYVIADTSSTDNPVVQAAGNSSGLADVLHGRAEVPEVTHDVVGEMGLRLVLPGSDGSLYSEVLRPTRVREVLNELGRHNDLVIVEVAPTAVNADAQTLATVVDGVVLVTTAKRTTREEVVESIDQFGHVEANVVGAVLAHMESGVARNGRLSISGAHAVEELSSDARTDRLNVDNASGALDGYRQAQRA